MNKRFADLVPGDKFAIGRSQGDVMGVCVIAPSLFKTEKYWFRAPVEYYRAVCIELHPYMGAVEWNPIETPDTIVTVF